MKKSDSTQKIMLKIQTILQNFLQTTDMVSDY